MEIPLYQNQLLDTLSSWRKKTVLNLYYLFFQTTLYLILVLKTLQWPLTKSMKDLHHLMRGTSG